MFISNNNGYSFIYIVSYMHRNMPYSFSNIFVARLHVKLVYRVDNRMLII